MSAELNVFTKLERLPDPSYVFEFTSRGMQVICRVYEDRGSFKITREIYETDKGKPHWQKHVATFKTLAIAKYSTPKNSLANLYKTGG
jgi:hypothetical protein